MLRLVLRATLAALALIAISVIALAAYVGLGWRSESHLDGALRGMPVHAPVVVLRDARGIPHVRAQSEHDLFVAQGYVEGADRLFQIDLLRHLVYGRLSEWFGSRVLPADERARSFDIAEVIATQYARLSADDRAELEAFADGMNAAIGREPLPVEYRLLWIRPERWKPEDALAVGFATVLSLTEPWDDVIERERVYERFGEKGLDGLYSVSDPSYDAPVTGGPPAPISSLPPLAQAAANVGKTLPAEGSRGSNAWAAGAARAADHRALLANDPHLDITMPGVWYLIELEAPDFHVAGATLPGVPGVILGHNEHVAWGATNGNVACESVYRRQAHGTVREEIFHVRFGRDVVQMYARGAHGFVAFPNGFYSVDWPAAANPSSPGVTFNRLDRASSVEDALAVLRTYPGPTQNFVLADTAGSVAYHMAGEIPNDPFWALRVHAASDPHYPALAFDRLPQVPPSRDAVVFTANNRVYGRDYPLRLSAWFAPPYRADRIAQLLRARRTYDVAYFSTMQQDALSLPERELAGMALAAARRRGLAHDPTIAPALEQLVDWNGAFDPSSKAASIMYDVRRAALTRFIDTHFSMDEREAYRSSSDVIVVLLRALRERPKGYFPHDDPDGFLIAALRDAAHEERPWNAAGAIPVHHVFSAFGIPWFNGTPRTGDGDAYTVHAQFPFSGQSFRAVWDVGNWDTGGIVIPTGESGRPGSLHYDDGAATWNSGTLVPLPFSASAVDAATRHRLILFP